MQARIGRVVAYGATLARPRWASRWVHFWIAVALVIGSGLVAPPRSAFAAISLTADPTEVKVKTKSEMGTTRLSWDSGNGTSIQIYVSVNNGAFGPTGFGGPIGTQVAYTKIQHGNTYHFRQHDLSGQPIPRSPTVTVTVKLEQVELHLGCAVQCIRDIDAHPTGRTAAIHVTTTVDVTFLIQASTDPPNANGSCKQTALAGTLLKLNPSKVFDGTFTDLDPGTKHCLKVVAKDANGTEATIYRSFTTHQRYVTVHFDKINIINDGDGDGAGEIGFGFAANGIWAPSIPEADYNSTTSIYPNRSVLLIENDPDVEIFVVANEDDGPFDQWGDAAEMKRQFSLTNPAPVTYSADGESYEALFIATSVHTWGDPTLEFQVEGRYVVGYGPIP